MSKRFKNQTLERRKKQNDYFKYRAEQAIVSRWPRKRLLTPERPCRYTGIARYYRIRKKLRENTRQARPIRVTDAVERPLINFQKVRRGEQIAAYDFEQKHYANIVSFWTYWLHEIHNVVSQSGKKLGEPILDLRRLLLDLSEGRTTRLTELLSNKRAKSCRGRPKDPAPVARHKLVVALCYRILTAITLRKQQSALWTLKSILFRMGYEHKLRRRVDVRDSSIPDYTRKLISKKYKEKSELPKFLFNTDEHIRFFIFNFFNQIRYDVAIMNEVTLLFEELYYREQTWSEKEWRELVTQFRDALFACSSPSLKWIYLKAWLRAENVTCSVTLALFSEKSELKRYGLVT